MIDFNEVEEFVEIEVEELIEILDINVVWVEFF